MGAGYIRAAVTVAAAFFVLLGAPSASASCSIAGADAQTLLYQDANFVVVAAPSTSVTVDLGAGYPPPPQEAAPYVYATNFQPSSAGTTDHPLHVRVCASDVPATTAWSLQLWVDDLLGEVANARIPAEALQYRRRLLQDWSSASVIPEMAYAGFGSETTDLFLYFRVRLAGNEPAGRYEGALHFRVLLMP